MWTRLPEDGSAGNCTVRIGARTFDPRQIRSVTRQARAERDNIGLLALAAISLLAAAAIANGVVVSGWRPRFLIAALLLGGFGLASAWEAHRATTQRYTRIKIETHDGEILFATADAAEADALQAVLASA